MQLNILKISNIIPIVVCFVLFNAFTPSKKVETKIVVKHNPEFDSTFNTAWEHYLNTFNSENLNPYLYDFSSFKSPVNICLTPDSNGFVMPVCNSVTSNFGPRGGKAHNGIDIDLNTGDTVVSAFDGIVRMSKFYFGYGNMVVVRHPNGLETLYGHLSKVTVEPGQTVKAGECVGLGGNTGHSSGSHLHFEIRFMGQPIDPSKFISFENFSLVNNEIIIDESIFTAPKVIKKQRESKIAPAKKGKTYTIKKGDSLYSIAKKHKVSVTEICKNNGINKKMKLKPGRKLKV